MPLFCSSDGKPKVDSLAVDNRVIMPVEELDNSCFSVQFRLRHIPAQFNLAIVTRIFAKVLVYADPILYTVHFTASTSWRY